MSETIRRIFLTSIGIVGLAGAALTFDPAMAQQGTGSPSAAAQESDAPPQIALTQKQIDDLVATQPDLAALQPPDPAKGPDPKMQARMESAVKKHGFAGLDAYESVFESVGIVLAGIDPETKTYVGQAAVIKKQMAQVQADKSLSAKDRDQALSDMKEALAAAGTVKPAAGNADLVVKNYDKLSGAFKGAD